jgi:putative endonuclease
MTNNITSSHEKGDHGENQAVEFLISKGYVIICRNFRCSKGEIDCIAKDPDGIIVFVEVKSSSRGSFGNPVFWVTPAKQKTLARMAQLYLVEHRLVGLPCRFDVVTIYNGKIEHLKNAFLIK